MSHGWLCGDKRCDLRDDGNIAQRPVKYNEIYSQIGVISGERFIRENDL
jgi:hypothetical protein